LSKANIFDKAYALSKSWKKKQFGDPKRIKNQETDPMRNNPVTLKNGGGQSLTPYEKMLKSV
jgi:hypothetical protein